MAWPLIAAAAVAGGTAAWLGRGDEAPAPPPELFENAHTEQQLADALYQYYMESDPEFRKFAGEVPEATRDAVAGRLEARDSLAALAEEYGEIGDSFRPVAERGADDLLRLGDAGRQSAAALRARLSVGRGIADGRMGRNTELARRGIATSPAGAVGESALAGGLEALAGAEAAETERRAGEGARINAIPQALRIMSLKSGALDDAAMMSGQAADEWTRGAERLGGIYAQGGNVINNAGEGYSRASDHFTHSYNAQLNKHNADRQRDRDTVGDFFRVAGQVMGAGGGGNPLESFSGGDTPFTSGSRYSSSVRLPGMKNTRPDGTGGYKWGM